MIIKVHKGNYFAKRFKILDKNKKPVNIGFKNIIMTFKDNFSSPNILFKKSLHNGDITKDDEGYYHFSINPEDTQDLKYADYVFDIQIRNESPKIKKTIVTGMLRIEPVTTN